MKYFEQALKWLRARLDDIKAIAIAVLVVFVIIFFIQSRIDRHRVVERARQNATIEAENKALKAQADSINNRIERVSYDIKVLTEKYNKAVEAKGDYKKIVSKVVKERDDLRRTISDMSSNELLQRLAKYYPFDGVDSIIINDRQLEEIIYITVDHKILQEKDSLLEDYIVKANNQIAIGDSLRSSYLEAIDSYKSKNDNAYKSTANLVEQNDSYKKENKQLKRKIVLVEVVSGVAIATVILLAL